MHIYVQNFEYLCAKMLDWGFCFLNIMAKDKYDAERRDTGARTDKDPDGNELRIRFHQGGRELAC